MDKLIEKFPAQMLEAVELTKGIRLSKREYTISNVLVCGLGGSGIGGNLVFDLTADQITVPILVNKGYELPSFADDHTLLILCSYSGNTEETLSCAAQAIERGLKPVCVASGGKLGELAKKHALISFKCPVARLLVLL